MKPLYLKIIAVDLFFMGLTGLQAQKVNIDVERVRCQPIIDGIEEELWNDVKTINLAVHPNPVTDFLTILADFDKVVINNMLGQEISRMNKLRTNKLDIGYLSKGVFFIKVYKGERYIGAARIMKI